MLPKVVIHNSISLDEPLTNFEPNMELHYRIAGNYKPQVHLIGSNTVKVGIELFAKRRDTPPSECTGDQLGEDKALKDYHAKRDFKATAEPQGSDEKTKGTSKIFVVQEHQARRLHYDFRLERDGVLKSWAVPKGIPENTADKRLAVETEDHPIDYAQFEGTIPEGQYGAGTVTIWDKGTYETKVWNEKMIEFTLHGKKLTGRYVLVRLKRGGDKNWLMLKGKE